MRIAVGITGASGVILGIRLVEELARHTKHVSVVITDHARQVMIHEIGTNYRFPPEIREYREFDAYSPLNSSSNRLDALVIMPCSMKTLAAIASGYSANLVTRAAENILRSGGKLILAPRETPLSTAALQNMLQLRRDGAIILPPVIAFYHHPQSVNDMIDFLVGKVLDVLGISHTLYTPWGKED